MLDLPSDVILHLAELLGSLLSSKCSAEILIFDDHSDNFLTTRPVVVWIEILTHVQKCVCCAAV